MQCRLYGMYKRYLKGDAFGMENLIKETLSVIDNAIENEMDEKLTDYYYEMLQRMLVDVATKNMMSAQQRLRTMAYLHEMFFVSHSQ